MKKTVAVLDDDRMFVSLLKGMLEKWSKREGEELEIEGFARPQELVLGERLYDLIFMDIILPGGNGIELAERLKQTGRMKDVIYVSAQDRNVFQVFGSRPIAYIRKTCLESDLEKAMELYVDSLKKSRVYITEGKKVHCFCPDEIMYLKSNKHYIEFFMGDGRNHLLRGKMDDMEMALKEYGYIRTHVSYLVNPKYVTRVDKNYIRLTDSHCCRVSMKYKKEVYKKFYAGE